MPSNILFMKRVTTVDVLLKNSIELIIPLTIFVSYITVKSKKLAYKIISFLSTKRESTSEGVKKT